MEEVAAVNLVFVALCSRLQSREPYYAVATFSNLSAYNASTANSGSVGGTSYKCVTKRWRFYYRPAGIGQRRKRLF